MADLIKIKGGSGEVPKLQDRELAYSKDGKALYIGTDDGNVRLCGESDLDMIMELNTTITSLSNVITEINARLDALEKDE
jgi:hypothetical protein